MNPKAFSLAAAAAGAILILVDLGSGTPINMAGSAAVSGAILIAGAMISLAIRSK